MTKKKLRTSGLKSRRYFRREDEIEVGRIVTYEKKVTTRLAL